MQIEIKIDEKCKEPKIIVISICIGSPPRYGYSIGKSRTDFYRSSIGGCFRNIGGNFYGNLIPVCMGG